MYTCNYHPGTVLIGSWHPKHSLPAAFLITLISADSFCCFTSDYFPERAGGNYNNAPARLEQSSRKQNPATARRSWKGFHIQRRLLYLLLHEDTLCCVMLSGLLYSREQGGAGGGELFYCSEPVGHLQCTCKVYGLWNLRNCAKIFGFVFLAP